MPEPTDNSATAVVEAEPKQTVSDPSATAGDGKPAADDKSTVEVPERFQKEDGELDGERILKSYSEIEKQNSRLGNKNSELQKQVDQSEVNAKVLEALERIGQKGDSGSEQESAETYIARRVESGDWEDPAVMMADMANMNSAWIEQATGETKKALEKLSADNAELKTLLDKKTNPDYIKHKDRIAKLKEFSPDMSDEAALKIALDEASQSSETDPPPAAILNGRTTETGTVKSGYWKDEEKAEFIADKTKEAILAGKPAEFAKEYAEQLAVNMEEADKRRNSQQEEV